MSFILRRYAQRSAVAAHAHHRQKSGYRHLENLPPAQQQLWGRLKPLVYFGDGDLHTLAQADRRTLVQAARFVGDLPKLELAATELGPAREKAAHQAPGEH
ncbi:MAG: hypothetical protein AB1651_18940 [Pseudomonadota bacterium]